MVGVGLCMATPTVQAQEQVAPMQVALSADQKLAEAVATELQSSGATGFAIDITCNKGVVELTGVVRDQSEKSKILNTVSRVAGCQEGPRKISGARGEGHSASRRRTAFPAAATASGRCANAERPDARPDAAARPRSRRRHG
jgi:hypothetical protein